MRRYARRRDISEPAIVLALREAGATVVRIDASGVPDLLVGYKGLTYMIECKTGTRVGGRENKSKTLQRQAAFRASWLGRPVAVVETPAEALAAIGASTEETPND